ncbi:unnamed protein product [Oikopleura dioica]|uniref:Uncharacterized protein n=1 Tax=Oikopleura dioica TaxID=34765 RepID=E4XGF5_OIKDI|nr:unnamed protein product [Oikopleura dioica]CBY41004.1 unnamed protein product [Oikopleura dioica]
MEDNNIEDYHKIDAEMENDDFHIQRIQLEGAKFTPQPSQATFQEDSSGENKIIKFLHEQSPFENETITLVAAFCALFIFLIIFVFVVKICCCKKERNWKSGYPRASAGKYNDLEREAGSLTDSDQSEINEDKPLLELPQIDSGAIQHSEF